MKVVNQTRGMVLADRVQTAKTWRSRLRGLLLRDCLPEGHCLVLEPCNSVHTCFMKFNIDVLFVDSRGTVVYLLANLPPFRFSPVVRNAEYVIELPADTIRSTGTAVNDRLGIYD